MEKLNTRSAYFYVSCLVNNHKQITSRCMAFYSKGSFFLFHVPVTEPGSFD